MRALVRSRTASEDGALNPSSRPNLVVHSPRPHLDSFKEKQSPITPMASPTATLTSTSGYSIMHPNYYTQRLTSPSVSNRSCSSIFRLWSCLILTVVGLVFLLNWEVMKTLPSCGVIQHRFEETPSLHTHTAPLFFRAILLDFFSICES
jgi:hypothetical protein